MATKEQKDAMNTRATGKQTCCKCHRRSLAGFVSGKGHCQYHWTAHCYGQAWADKLAEDYGEGALPHRGSAHAP